MAFDQGDQAFFAILVKDENEAKARLRQSREEVVTWVQRAKLAHQKGNLELAQLARQRAVDAKAAFDETERELQSIKLKKADLRRRTQLPDSSEALIEAEVLLEQFRMQGINPEEGEVEQISRRMEAEMELEAMKGEQ